MISAQSSSPLPTTHTPYAFQISCPLPGQSCRDLLNCQLASWTPHILLNQGLTWSLWLGIVLEERLFSDQSKKQFTFSLVGPEQRERQFSEGHSRLKLPPFPLSCLTHTFQLLWRHSLSLSSPTPAGWPPPPSIPLSSHHSQHYSPSLTLCPLPAPSPQHAPPSNIACSGFWLLLPQEAAVPGVLWFCPLVPLRILSVCREDY